MTLTDEQTRVKNALQAFVLNNEQMFTLSGVAGSGKTTLLQHALKPYENRLILCAPTHRACDVLSASFKKKAITLHNLLGLLPDVNLANFNPEYPEFSQQLSSKLFHEAIIVLDEASMVGRKINEKLLETAKLHFAKIIFVGDSEQLEAVGDEESSIFNEKTYHLTRIMRTEKAGIQHFSTKVRDGYFGLPNYRDIDESIRIVKLEDYKFDDTVIVSYTNARVQLLNGLWRRYNNPTLDLLKDKFVTNRNLTLYKPNGSHTFIKNGETFEILELLSAYKWRTTIGILPLSSLSNEEYLRKYNELVNKANITKDWGEFYKFKDSNLRMLPASKELRADYSFTYASTVHKAQGSTFDNVAIDYRSFTPNYIKENVRQKLFYTAVSRASQRLTILI